jgi:CRP-like cAMP-binding protein
MPVERAPIHQLRNLLTSTYGISPILAHELSSAFVPCAFAANSIVAHQGSDHPELYFLAEGLWRIFYLARDGKEFNKAFVHENMFFVALSSQLQQEPLRFSVQVLEATRALRMPYVQFDAWVEREPELARLFRRYMEAHFVRHEAREATLLLEDAAGRYRWFLRQHPGLIDRVPLYQVASYLGITNVTLSRVRRAVSF